MTASMATLDVATSWRQSRAHCLSLGLTGMRATHDRHLQVRSDTDFTVR